MIVPPLLLAAWLGRSASWRPTSLRVWEPEKQGSLLYKRTGEVAFSPDGRTLAVSVGTLQARVYRRVAANTRFPEVKYPDPTVAVQLWDVSSRTLRCTLESKGDELAQFAFSPDSQLVALRTMRLGRNGGRVQVFKSATGARLWQISSEGEVRSSSGKHFIGVGVKPFVVSSGGKALSYDVTVTSVPSDDFAPKTSRVYRHTNYLQRRDLRTGTLLTSIETQWIGRKTLLADAPTIVSRCTADTVQLFKVASGAERPLWKKNFPGGENAIRLSGALISPDSALVAVANTTLLLPGNQFTSRRFVEVLDARNGQRFCHIEPSGILPLDQAAFSPRSDVLALSSNGVVQLWAPRIGKLLRTLNAQNAKPRTEVPLGFPALNTLAFSPNGSQLAVAADDGTVTLWRVR